MESVLQYLAGIVDSEGYFRLQNHKKCTILGADFKVEMADKEPIELLSIVFNLPIKISDRGKDRKLMYSVSAYKHNIRSVIDKLLPYLNEKRRSAKIIAKYLDLDVEQSKAKAVEFHNTYLKYRYKALDVKDVYMSAHYLAGIIDGDGYISIVDGKARRGSTYGEVSIKLGLEQCFKALPTYLHLEYGGSISVRKPKSTRHRISYSWYVGKDVAHKILTEVRGKCLVKNRRIEIALELIELREKYRLIIREEQDRLISIFRTEVTKTIRK